MGNINFNGISSKDLGVEVETFPDYVAPQKEFEAVHVPSRNGDVLIDTGAYQNVSRPYKINAYAPADPVQTKSGSAVSFNSSAAIPLKNLECEITPKQDLHGYDHPWPAGGGKNKCNFSNITATAGGSEYPVLGDVYLPIGTFTLSFTVGSTITGERNRPLYGIDSDVIYCPDDYFSSGRNNWTFTTTRAGIYQFKWRHQNLNANCNITDFQLEVGSTATAYEPYSNICPIIGHSELNLTRCGKNFVALNASPYQSAVNTWVSVNSESTDLLSITSSAVAYACRQLYYKLPAGTYTVSLGETTKTGTETPVVSIYDYPNGTLIVNALSANNNVVITLSDETVLDIRLFATGNTAEVNTVTFSDFQIELGSTATPYEPYNGQTFTIAFGQTVYGGVYDKSGRLTITHRKYLLSDMNWNYRAGFFRTMTISSDIKKPDSQQTLTDSKCEIFNNVTWNDVGDHDNEYAILGPTGGELIVKCSSCSNLTEWASLINGYSLVYELATPIVIDVPSISVNAENGTNNIFSDTGEIEVTFGGEAFSHVMSRISEWLLSPSGYSRLEDTYDEDVYRMAYYGGNPNIANIFNEAGQADIEFICKPQRFLKSGEKSIVFNSNGTINNFTNHPALPLLKIVSNNTLESGSDIVGTIYIGNHALSIKNDETIPAGTNITIIADCELQNAYSEVLGEEINRNNLIVLNGEDMPRIEPGIQQITFDGGIQSVEVVPRWWTV